VDPQLSIIYEGFAIERGSWRRNPGRARLTEHISRIERSQRDKLALVIDVISESAVPSIVYDRLFAAFSSAFARSEGDLSAALEAGYDGANALVLDMNSRADEAHQLLVGLQAAVIHEGWLYIAQAGPVVSVHWHHGKLSIEPPDSPWLYADGVNPSNETRDLALGETQQVSPRYNRLHLSPGDALLLCNTAVVAALSDDELLQIMAASHEDALPALLGPRLHQVEAVGMMLTVAPGPETIAFPEPAPVAILPPPESAELQAVVKDEPEEPVEPPPRAPAPPVHQLGSAVLLITAAAIPLVLMIMVIFARVQYDALRRREFNELRSTAQQQYQAALEINDTLAQRRAMNEALARTEEGLLAMPRDEELLALQQRIINRLDQINAVSRLYRMTKLLDLDDPGMSAATSRISVSGSNLFLLNRGSNRVYHLRLDQAGEQLQPLDANSLVIQPGQQLGGVSISHLVDAVWMDADAFVRKAQLMVLERSGSLLAYDPEIGVQGISIMPVGNSDQWLGPQSIGKYDGNIYILDPLQSRILKYVPVEGAYTLPPIDYIDPMLGIDLTGAVDMAIDGNIYVLYVNGQILKFLEGVPQPFTMEGLPAEMTSPLQLCVTPDESTEKRGYVYVADPGSRRILQFDKQGNYIRQFMANPDADLLGDLQAFYVDEPSGRLFIAADDVIWLTTLPPRSY